MATRTITYTLRAGKANSDEYYHTIAALAEQWFPRAKSAVKDVIAGFREYQQAQGKAERTDEEYAFELLALGVLLGEHGQEANHMPKWAERILRWLAAVRDRRPQTENITKTLRGWVGWMASHMQGREERGDVVAGMITWLGANEESAKEKRFTQWHDYFETNGKSFTQTAVSHCLELAEDFARISQEALGKYTERVERFLTEEAPRHRWRYDAGLLARTRLEYHLGMLGSEILNRAYRQRFLAAKRKIVILPPCMRAQLDGKCKATMTPFGEKCQACTPTCRIHQITQLGKKHGFEVYMIPDELRVFGSGKGDGSLGVVGVSCALTNWNGGWETEALGIAAQGVLLDYVGCKFHWDDKGFSTDTNVSKLLEVIGGSRPPDSAGD